MADEEIKTKKFHVAIVGGGISGLYSAYHLSKNAKFKVSLIEASNYWGGRIKQIKMGNSMIDLGAEFIHGEKNILHDLYTKTLGLDTILFSYSDSESESEEEEMSDKEEREEFVLQGDKCIPMEHKRFQKWCKIIEKIHCMGKAYKKPVTVGEILRKSFHADERMLRFMDCYWASEENTTIDKLDLHQDIKMESNWHFGCMNQHPCQGFQPLIQYLVSEIRKRGVDMKLEYPILTIEHGDNGVVLNQSISADACILTPSLKVLPEMIFIPDLPDQYQEAMTKINVNRLAKVVIRVDKSLCAGRNCFYDLDGYCTEIWFRDLFPPDGGVDHFIIGWLPDTYANVLDTISHDDIVKQTVQRVRLGIKEEFKVLESLIFDWGEQPFISGGYSSPSLGEANARNILMKPIENRLFFAGEALHKCPQTIQAAMESGLNACQILENNFD